MKSRPWKKWFLILLALALILRVFSGFRPAVEQWYSNGLYPLIGLVSRKLTGWLPFSLGDWLYLALGTWLLIALAKLLRNLVRRDFQQINLWKTGAFWLAVYLYFNLFWGLNYNRLGIAYQLQLEIKEPVPGELESLCKHLLELTNSYADQGGRKQVLDKSRVLSGVMASYESAAKKYPFLTYRGMSLKPSVFGVVGNYVGYTGYYHPLTGEAQVNDRVPSFLIPFVSCHEIAHQLGYARENEANFVGFLAARESRDSLFLYSAYLDMFLYANGQLYRSDSVIAQKNYKNLAPEVQRDLAELRAFRLKYKSPIEDWVDTFYNMYLKANQQPAGTKNYGRVVLWLLAERRKN